jgi:hypothetical protein
MKRLGTSYVLLTLALVACGGDAQQRPRVQGNLEAACQTDLALTQAVAAAEEAVGQPPEGPPPPEFISRLGQSFEQRVLPVYVRLERNAPGEIRTAVRQRGQALRDFIQAPELENLDRLFAPDLSQPISAFFYRECPGNKASIEGVDYAFRNLTDLEAGVTRIEFNNTGKELHEVVFVSAKPGVTEPLEDLLKLWSPAGPEAAPEYHEKVTETFVAFAEPGQKSYFTHNLEAGEYIAVCFIPRGATGPEPPDPEAPPHFELGMRENVTVA